MAHLNSQYSPKTRPNIAQQNKHETASKGKHAPIGPILPLRGIEKLKPDLKLSEIGQNTVKMDQKGHFSIHIVTCQVHPALVKGVQCMVHSSFLKFLGSYH